MHVGDRLRSSAIVDSFPTCHVLRPTPQDQVLVAMAGGSREAQARSDLAGSAMTDLGASGRAHHCFI